MRLKMAQLTAQQKAAFAQYKNNKVISASGPELTLMLYDGAIKFLNIADVAIEKKDIQKAHINIVKTEKIIEYLWNTLDMKYEVAKDFENMYSYISRRLIEANITKDREIVAEINEHMHAIRDNWVQVMKANNIAVKEA
ncbi:flagellar export chaperone FliS [Butyrivibrio fibrisolvens]|jgi:flagellar protein FliS|nr:flagellar export chaperone FliS [Butyrivibrio fibrisolvens]